MLEISLTSFLIIFIDGVGITLSIVAALKILSQNQLDKFPKRFLVTLLILSSLTLTNDLVLRTGLSAQYKQLYFIPIYYTLAIGPLFYFFIKSKTKVSIKYTELMPHLILPILQALLYFSIGFLSIEAKSELWRNQLFRTYLTIESFLFPISLLTYSLMSLRITKRLHATNPFWKNDINNWLKRFVLGGFYFSLVEFCYVFLVIASATTDFDFSLSILVHSTIVSSFLVWIAINTLQYLDPQKIYKSRPPSRNQENTLANIKLADQINHLMASEKLFLNPDLDIGVMAHYLNVSIKEVSSSINSVFGKNFNQYVNYHRIEEFKLKLRNGNHQQMTLISIAYDCGFDSKTTFNRAFKAIEGTTPTTYIKSIRHFGEN